MTNWTASQLQRYWEDKISDWVLVSARRRTFEWAAQV